MVLLPVLHVCGVMKPMHIFSQYLLGNDVMCKCKKFKNITMLFFEIKDKGQIIPDIRNDAV